MPSPVLDAGYRLGSETDTLPVIMELSIHCTGGKDNKQMYV